MIELLVGELEETPTDIIEQDELSYKIEGDTELNKVERELKLDLESGAATLSGWIVEQLGGIPQKGDEFHYEKFNVSITKVDEKRVLEAVIKLDPPTEEEE